MDSIEKSEFSQNLELADITLVFMRNDHLKKSKWSTCQRITRGVKIFRKNNAKANKLMISLLVLYLSIYAAIEKDLIPRKPY